MAAAGVQEKVKEKTAAEAHQEGKVVQVSKDLGKRETKAAEGGKEKEVPEQLLNPDEISAEICTEEAVAKRPPGGITNEAELLSSPETAKR